MKKKILKIGEFLLIGVMLIAMLTFLTGCGEDDDDDDDDSEALFVYENASAEKVNKETLSKTEITTFNEPILQYCGDSVVGSSVKGLVSYLVTNASENEGEEDYLPSVELCGTSTGDCVAEGGEDAADDSDEYVSNLQEISSSIMTKHNYYVEVDYDDDERIDTVVIRYDEDSESTLMD